MLLYSLFFGFLAWGLAAIAIKKPRCCSVLVTGSFLACCISAAVQFFEIQHRANAGDFSGIMDTIRSTIIGIVVMMAVTLILNLIALIWRDLEEKV